MGCYFITPKAYWTGYSTRFVEEGAYVFITGRRQEELDKAKALIGKNVTAVKGDVTSTTDLDNLFTTIKAEKGKLDIVVANSGQVIPTTFEDITEEHFDKIFNLNARGALFTVQKARPLMINGGSIILVGTGAANKGWSGYTTYSATKAALRSFARSWTAEFKDSGIRVNVLSPGPIDSKEGADAVRVYFAANIPLGHMGRSEEVAGTALFLASV